MVAEKKGGGGEARRAGGSAHTEAFVTKHAGSLFGSAMLSIRTLRDGETLPRTMRRVASPLLGTSSAAQPTGGSDFVDFVGLDFAPSTSCLLTLATGNK